MLFVGSSVLLALSPSPDNLFVLFQSATFGKNAGIIITFGLCTGLIFHTSLVAFGVASLISSTVWAFTILKSMGAAYLLYLAYKMFTSEPISELKTENKERKRNLYLKGILMNVTNPKVTIFFLAFLPQFIVPNTTPIPQQMIVLGLVFMVTTFVVFSVMAIFASHLGKYLNGPDKVSQTLNRATGCVFAALAIRLLLTKVT